MPVMPTMLKCSHCGTMGEVTLQSREALEFSELVKIVAATHLCKACRRKYNWLASQGREAEFGKQTPAEMLKVLR